MMFAGVYFHFITTLVTAPAQLPLILLLVFLQGLSWDFIHLILFSSYLDEKQHLQQELEQLKDRMEAVSDEFETINEDRVKFLEEIDGLKRQLQTASQEKDASQRNYTKQVWLDIHILDEMISIA